MQDKPTALPYLRSQYNIATQQCVASIKTPYTHQHGFFNHWLEKHVTLVATGYDLLTGAPVET
jgi:hypothetical protein